LKARVTRKHFNAFTRRKTFKSTVVVFFVVVLRHTEWHTKFHTIDYTQNTFLLLQKHLTSGKELILIGWKIVPNEEHVQCDHRFSSQPLANEPTRTASMFAGVRTLVRRGRSFSNTETLVSNFWQSL
jgi:hypothetical protein